MLTRRRSRYNVVLKWQHAFTAAAWECENRMPLKAVDDGSPTSSPLPFLRLTVYHHLISSHLVIITYICCLGITLTIISPVSSCPTRSSAKVHRNGAARSFSAGPDMKNATMVQVSIVYVSRTSAIAFPVACETIEAPRG